METKGFSPDFFETLNAYDWPGNVRELIHTMDRALTVARFEPTLFPRHLPTKLRVHEARVSVSKNETGKEKSEEDTQPAKRSQRKTRIRPTCFPDSRMCGMRLCPRRKSNICTTLCRTQKGISRTPAVYPDSPNPACTIS